MKRFYLVLLSFIVLVVAAVGINFHTKAQTTEQEWTKQPYFVSQSIVISQFYGGGGQANAPYTNDFVELFNRGSAPVSLNGFSVQYAGATSSNWLVTPLSNITLQPGQYYLIQYASNGTVGSALPTPDLIAPQVTTTSGTFIPNLSSTKI